MAYVPTNWKSGDVVTSAKLNNIEQGIASGGVLVVNVVAGDVPETYTLDKTWQEIADAAFAVTKAPNTAEGVQNAFLLGHCIGVAESNGAYMALFAEIDSTGNISIARYSASAADGYPEQVS